MSNVPAWLLVITGLGSGFLGSVITTYGTQTRERRQARATARDALRHAEGIHDRSVRYVGGKIEPSFQQLTDALNEFETAAMLAGLPRP